MNELGSVRQPIFSEYEFSPTSEIPVIPIVLPSVIPVSNQVINSMDVPGYIPVDQGGIITPGSIPANDRGGVIISYGADGVNTPIIPTKPSTPLPVIKPTTSEQPAEAEKGFFEQTINIFGFEFSYLQLTIGGGVVGLLVLIFLLRK